MDYFTLRFLIFTLLLSRTLQIRARIKNKITTATMMTQHSSHSCLGRSFFSIKYASVAVFMSSDCLHGNSAAFGPDTLPLCPSLLPFIQGWRAQIFTEEQPMIPYVRSHPKELVCSLTTSRWKESLAQRRSSLAGCYTCGQVLHLPKNSALPDDRLLYLQEINYTII